MEGLVRLEHGFTLWELMWTIGIAGVVLGAGVPAMETFLLDGRRTAAVNGWILAVQAARSEAFKRQRPVIACGTTDGVQCSSRMDSGWMVFVNEDDEYPPRRNASEPLLYRHEPELSGTILSNRAYYEFRVGRRSTNGTVVFCDRRGARTARAVIVSYTGRPRVDQRDASGAALRCAALT
jgi:type IV fimbrial biogenesis protein FimT